MALFAGVILAIGLAAPVSAAVNCTTAPNSACGTVTGNITISSAGTYRVWSRVKVPDTTSNSFWLQVDNGAGIVIGDSASITPGQWVWVNYKLGQPTTPVDIALSVTSHRVVLTGRETGVQVDRVIFTTDTTSSSCTPPTGTGDACAATGVSPSPNPSPNPGAGPSPTPGAGSGSGSASPTPAGSGSSSGGTGLPGKGANPGIVTPFFTAIPATSTTPAVVSFAGQKVTVAGNTVQVLGYASGIGLVLLVAIIAWWLLHQRVLAHFRRQLVSGSPATSPQSQTPSAMLILPEDLPPDPDTK